MSNEAFFYVLGGSNNSYSEKETVTINKDQAVLMKCEIIFMKVFQIKLLMNLGLSPFIFIWKYY